MEAPRARGHRPAPVGRRNPTGAGPATGASREPGSRRGARNAGPRTWHGTDIGTRRRNVQRDGIRADRPLSGRSRWHDRTRPTSAGCPSERGRPDLHRTESETRATTSRTPIGTPPAVPSSSAFTGAPRAMTRPPPGIRTGPLARRTPSARRANRAGQTRPDAAPIRRPTSHRARHAGRIPPHASVSVGHVTGGTAGTVGTGSGRCTGRGTDMSGGRSCVSAGSEPQSTKKTGSRRRTMPIRLAHRS